MKIKITKIIIKNFRGIRSSEITFSKTNFLVGDNGTGKTSCLAVIARLMPILRGEERIFLDGDFLFHFMVFSSLFLGLGNDKKRKNIRILFS